MLLRGTPIAALGMLLWIFAGTQLPVPTLTVWGPFVFLGGGALILLGTLPFRRLAQIEAQPHQIIWNDTGIHFAHKGKLLFTMDPASVENISFYDDGAMYGIAVTLKDLSVTVHNPRIVLEDYIARTQKRYGCDVLFPYFGKRPCARLRCRL